MLRFVKGYAEQISECKGGKDMRWLSGLIVTLLMVSVSWAIEHPGCAGKSNDTCDTLALMINMKGKLCYRVMNVQALGNDAYNLACEYASDDRTIRRYTIEFSSDRKSYTVR